MLGSVLGVLYVLIYLILTRTHQIGATITPHFTDQKTRVWHGLFAQDQVIGK